MKYRDLVITIILCLLVPFYDLYLIYQYQNALCEDDQRKMRGGTLFVLLILGIVISFILCFVVIGIIGIIAIDIYLIIWHYRTAQAIAKESGNDNLPVLCLICAIFIPSVSFILIQNEINKMVGQE